jgi:hypothetical protein
MTDKTVGKTMPDVSDDDNDSSAIGDQSHLLTNTGNQIVIHSPAPSALESRNEMHFTDGTANKLSGDEVAIIFSFLTPKVIMRLRRVCSKWRDATQITIVPLTEFEVNSVETYNAMRVMSTALPNLQQISLKFLGHEHKYSDGEDLDERMAANTANYTALDIDIISRFRNLHTFEIYRAPLNGRYPALFDFPFLQKLTISDFNDCSILKWDLEMLSGLPSLKELDCCDMIITHS